MANVEYIIIALRLHNARASNVTVNDLRACYHKIITLGVRALHSKDEGSLWHRAGSRNLMTLGKVSF